MRKKTENEFFSSYASYQKAQELGLLRTGANIALPLPRLSCA
jgi:hypothetical protein